MTIILTTEQQHVLLTVIAWFKSKERPYITLGGYAGTGKTTLLGFLRSMLANDFPELKVAFCAFTGKASTVLKSKLFTQKMFSKGDFVGTIHSLIYSAVVDIKTGHVITWEKKPKSELEYDLIVVDEASMVSGVLWRDLCSYGISILAVGDHGQLSPIDDVFNLMKDPYIRLETIHRQAAENPIIQVSLLARQQGYIPIQSFGKGVVKVNRYDSETPALLNDWLQSYNEDTLVLAGYNKTRIRLNQEIRALRDLYDPAPQVGDRVICLKNNRKQHLYNGMQGVLHTIYPLDEETDPHWYYADISMDDGSTYFSGPIAKEQFNSESGLVKVTPPSTGETGNYFDYGYALTVHKAQGAQANRVILFEERFQRMDDDQWRRWLYTAVTRAEKELFIVGVG
ncbi:MAG: ATP-dependent RecD-like DNA helicase [bacterium]